MAELTALLSKSGSAIATFLHFYVLHDHVQLGKISPEKTNTDELRVVSIVFGPQFPTSYKYTL